MIAEADELLSKLPKKENLENSESLDSENSIENPVMPDLENMRPSDLEKSVQKAENSGISNISSEEKRKEELYAETKEQEERLKNETIE